MVGLGCLCRISRATMARWYRWDAWHHYERGHSPWALHVQLGERERERERERQRERERERERERQRDREPSSVGRLYPLRRRCPQQESFLQTERENEIFKQDCARACMHDSKGHSIYPRNMLPNFYGHRLKDWWPWQCPFKKKKEELGVWVTKTIQTARWLLSAWSWTPEVSLFSTSQSVARVTKSWSIFFKTSKRTATPPPPPSTRTLFVWR